MRKTAAMILAILMAVTVWVPAGTHRQAADPVYAAQTAASEGSAAAESKADADNVITGFVPLETSEYYFEGEPTEEELLSQLPQVMEVHLGGSNAVRQIPVDWEMVEDYEDSDYYFYSARPVWSDDYTLSSDLKANADVPWVTLFRQNSPEEIDQGEAELEIPVEDPEDLEALYTEDDSETGDSELQRVLAMFTEETYAVSASDVTKIYKYLTETMGLNMAAACGVMTNLYAESGMQSNNLENKYNALYGLSDAQYTKRVNAGKKTSKKGKYTSGYGVTRYFTTDYSGYGICQWTTSGRRTKLLNAAIKKDVSIANLKMQLGVLQSELEDSYPQVLATLQGVPNNAAGVYLSAAYFCSSFEVPANTYNTAASRARTALSSYWKTYSGKSASATGTSYLGLCGYTYPTAVKKGSGLTASGYAISNYRIKKVTAKIVDSDGKAVYSSTKKPNASFYSLYNFDSKMRFSKLSAGTYTYKITVKDASGKSFTAKHAFQVKKKATTKVARGCATKNVSTSVETADTSEVASLQ